MNRILISIVAFLLAAPGHGSPPPHGTYSDWLDRLLTDQQYEVLFQETPDDSVKLNCLETEGRKYFIGVVQNMKVKAPIQVLTEVVSGIGSYAELFPGYAAIREVSREGSRVLTYWEQKIPVFFVPNVSYEMDYDLRLEDPSLKIFRYKLHQPGDLKESDGFIILKKISDSETRYLEIDFFDANWGVLEVFAPSRIWTDSVEGLYLSDLAFLLKAEHLDWSNRRCREAAEKALKALRPRPGEQCVQFRAKNWKMPFPGLPVPDFGK